MREYSALVELDQVIEPGALAVEAGYGWEPTVSVKGACGELAGLPRDRRQGQAPTAPKKKTRPLMRPGF